MNNKLATCLFPLILAFIGIGMASASTDRDKLNDVVILSVSDRPPDSGVYESWWLVTGVRAHGEIVNVFVPQDGTDIYIPRIGMKCDITVYTRDISGFIGPSAAKVKRALVSKNFNCRY